MSSVFAAKQFRPLALAVFCWLLVFLVPATRQGFSDAWKNHRAAPFIPDDGLSEPVDDVVSAGPFERTTRDAVEMLARYPNDQSVLMHAARAVPAATRANWKILAHIFPHDGLLVRLQLGDALQQDLPSVRPLGPLTNFPSTRPLRKITPLTPKQMANWEKAITLARWGQRAQPNNTYFDCMLLHCLLKLNRDDEARVVLKKAATKTRFDVYNRDDFQQRLRYLKLSQGEYLDPADLIATTSSWDFGGSSKFREVARRLMEMAMADRAAGRHARAIAIAMDLMKLGRLQRREGYSTLDSYTGSAMEQTALLNSAPPRLKGAGGAKPPRPGGSAQTYRAYSTSLSSYAKEQGRQEIPPLLDAEWSELGAWRSILTTSLSGGLQPYSMPLAATVQIAERLRTLILQSLPLVILLGIGFGLLSRRFERGVALPISRWRLGSVSMALILAALACDLTLTVRNWDPEGYDPMTYAFLNSSALAVMAPSWVTWGIAGALICLSANLLLLWRRKETGKHVGLKQRIKTIFHVSEDGLTRFDFGWMVGLVAKLTLWLLFIASLTVYCADSEFPNSEYAWALLSFWLCFALGLNAFTWLRAPARRDTLKSLPGFIASAMGGYFVTASVLYAVVAFGFLPLQIRFQSQFEHSIQQGDLQYIKQKLKLK